MFRTLVLALSVVGSLFATVSAARAQPDDPLSSAPHRSVPSVANADPALAEGDGNLPTLLFAKGKALFDLRRFASERRTVDAVFPNLRGDFEVLRPGSKNYNCIAWSLGITSQWVWPGENIALFDRLNARFGYKRLAGRADFRLSPGIEKIALYGKISGGRVKVTHQARQMADGTWTSKLGQMPLIRHRDPDAVDNASYGKPVAVYARRGG